MRYRKIKKMIITFVAGAMFATAGTAVATSVIERVTASVRTDYSVEFVWAKGYS